MDRLDSGLKSRPSPPLAAMEFILAICLSSPPLCGVGDTILEVGAGVADDPRVLPSWSSALVRPD